MECSERDQLHQKYLAAMQKHVNQEEKLKGTQPHEWEKGSKKSKEAYEEYFAANRDWMIHRSKHGC